MEHDRGDTVRTRSDVNRNTRNESAKFIWITEKIWIVSCLVVKYKDYESEKVMGQLTC